MRDRFVGLDVHARYCSYAIQDAKGQSVGSGDTPTSAAGLRSLREQYDLPFRTPVALETGTVSFHVARLLESLGMSPVVVDAHEVRVKASRPTQKSDRRDALELCEGLRRGTYRCIVHVPDPGISLLRETLSRRRHFRRIMAAEISAAKRLLRAQAVSRPIHTVTTLRAWNRLVESVADRLNLKRHIEYHRAVWMAASEQVCLLEEDLKLQQERFADQVRRLQAVPGIGPITALTMVAVFDDIERFPTAKHAASYIGVVPTTHQSGDRDSHGHITKRGSRELRALLCEAAQHASRASSPLNPYFTMLCAKRGYKSAVVAVAHRLVRILFAILRHGTEFDLNKLGVELGPFETRRVKIYRLKEASAV